MEPEFGLNLGYIARTMANFGLKKLIVVTPRKLDRKRIDDACLFASHGRSLIDKIEFVSSMDKLRRKFRLMIGTTAIEGTRKANLTRKTLDVEDCVSRLARRIESRPDATCIVFGRDTTGMTNEELRCCDYNVTIRTNSEYNTLNVSHAAAIVFFVLSKYLNKRGNRVRTATSTRSERARVVLLFEQLAEASEFQKFKSGLLSEAISRLFDRGDPSLREIYLLMGLASKATSKIKRLSSRQS